MLQTAIQQIQLASWWGEESRRVPKVTLGCPEDPIDLVHHAIIGAPGRIDAKEICAQTGLSISCVRHKCQLLTDAGLVIKRQEKKGGGICWEAPPKKGNGSQGQ